MMKYIIEFNKFHIYDTINEFQVGYVSISDIDKYLLNMESSLSDKMFWADKVDPDIIVDFGTADGSMLDKLSNSNPDIKLIGYDIDKEMISVAKSRVKDKAIITDDWDEVIDIVSNYKRPMVFLSSVIHEVYSYSHSSKIKYFWDNQIYGGLFKYVVIRDMMPSTRYEKFINKSDVNIVRSNSNPTDLKWFEDVWGPIGRDYRNFLHWLLKYKYSENFDREMLENYVPVTLETIKKKIPSNYKIIMEDHYILPYLKKQVKKDFGIEIKEPTHAKLIIERI